MVYATWEGSLKKNESEDAECLNPNVTNVDMIQDALHLNCRIVKINFNF